MTLELTTGNIGKKDVDGYNGMDILRDFLESNIYFENLEEEPNATAKEYNETGDDASGPIYPNNTDFIIFSFVNKLLHFKNKHLNNNGFDELLNSLDQYYLMIINCSWVTMTCERW